MSQVIKLIPTSGPGSGTVTSITFNGGLTSTPDPVTTTGTATIDQTNLTVLDGTVYWDTGTQLLNTTATGTAGQVLTSQGAAMPPIYATPSSGSGIVTIDGDTGSITGTIVTIYAHNSTQNSGSSVSFINSGTTSTFNVTDANANTIIGKSSGNASISGTGNTSLGTNNLDSLTSGSLNVAVGDLALEDLTTGNNNTAIGTSALNAIVSGSGNIALGKGAALNYVGSESSNITIGNAGVASENNAIRIGTQGSGAAQQDECFIAGITGVNVGSVATVTSIATGTGQLGTTTLTAGSNVTITPGAGTITIAATGGGGGGITTINTDNSGSVTGSTIDLFANSGSANAGATVQFIAASGTEIDLQLSDGSGNTALGSSAGTGAGSNNTVIGATANTSGGGSSNVVIGVGTSTSGGSNGVIIGNGSSDDTGLSSNIVIGNGATNNNSASSSISIGVGSSPGGSSDISIGTGATTNAQPNQITIGNGASSFAGSTGNTVVIGTSATATADESIVIGHSASSNNGSLNCIAIGTSASNNNGSSNCIAIGTSAITNNTGSICIGSGITDSAGTGSYIGGIYGTTPTDQDGVVIQDSAGLLTTVAPGTTNQVLISQGTGTPPIWGSVTTPASSVAFYVDNLLTNQTITTGTSIINFFDKQFDYGSNFNTSTSLFTAPNSGLYYFNFSVNVLNASTSDVILFSVNGLSNEYAGVNLTTIVQQTAVSSLIIGMSPGDTIGVYYESGGVATILSGATPYVTWFMGYQIA